MRRRRRNNIVSVVLGIDIGYGARLWQLSTPRGKSIRVSEGIFLAYSHITSQLNEAKRFILVSANYKAAPSALDCAP